MPHNCLMYWGNQAAALNSKLDAGYDDPQGGPGWATRLARRAEYETLVLLKDRLLAARKPPPPPIKAPLPWSGGVIGVNGLLDATTNMMGGLEGDRYSMTTDHHYAGEPYWHTTGIADPNSIIVMNQLWGRVRNALGC